MKIRIIKDDNPLMRERSKDVPLPLSKENKALLDAMLEYLKMSQNEEYAEKHHIRAGVGLAAVQVKRLEKMFVIYYENSEGQVVQYQLVNPKIIESSVKQCALKNGEGCLSVDKIYDGLVHRHYKIRLKAFDALQNKDIEISASGFDAVVLQHEYDHLDGIFFYDRIDDAAPSKLHPNEELI
ncbi:MAG: peptide deformylase [Bacilli bacterium]